ncbi:hypothetical protein [Microbacterium sp. PRC9]|uniref:hypothetical protein n=1 Tax=Microbacterium sp. PRC9 TaxID=2962591 RepID=UPI0028822289|nr:hypothetical protein [Microbacterium sp. PRC9]MDT0142792.1 hypothetical protein [Microbacterium sp. PRC9]
MSSSFESVTADLEAYLKAELPTTWKVLDGSVGLGNTTGLVLTYGLTGFSNKSFGGQLPLTQFAAEFDLVLSTPERDLVKAQARLLPALPLLLKALDEAIGISWENVEKAITDAGETWFRIPIQVLVSTANSEE